VIVTFHERKRKKTKHKPLQKVIDRTLQKYVDPDILKDLRLYISLKKLQKTDTAYGQLSLKTKTLPFTHFEIELDNTISIWQIKCSLRHELIHIKQIVNGERIICNDNFKAEWKKKEVEEDTDYYELPWEIEAFKLDNIR